MRSITKFYQKKLEHQGTSQNVRTECFKLHHGRMVPVECQLTFWSNYNIWWAKQYGRHAYQQITSLNSSLMGSFKCRKIKNDFECLIDGHYEFGKPRPRFCRFTMDRYFTVVLWKNSSSMGNITHGVPQGSLLGPPLFLIYNNKYNWNIFKAPFSWENYLKGAKYIWININKIYLCGVTGTL